MKKSITCILALAMACAPLLTACGGGDPATSSSANNDAEGYITVDPDATIVAGLNADYAPRKDKISQMEGAIDVAIVFDDTLAGWQALADEYMRLHNDAVAVTLISNYDAAGYASKATYEIGDENTEWDIVQGNVINSELWPSRLYNMQAAVYGKNAYAGFTSWAEVLTENAYITDKTKNTDCYIMNSINLNTGWFVNEEALQKAYEKGYTNAKGEKGYPVTWDDLISLCDYMVQCGYSAPLGISLDKDSILNSQFTWLLRVYGDYYYRNEYEKISKSSDYKVDLTSDTPEVGLNVSYNKLLSTILDTNSSLGYVGATSAKFKDFLAQMAKIKPYLGANATQVSFDNLRDAFLTQQENAPQILLDYVGSGILFGNADTVNANLFDYPTMSNEYVDAKTLTRDVGGNGGYLSIVKHDSDQNKLNLDFLKFVMSPYGQTVYYNALSKVKTFAPQGLTTVREDLVKVPDEWTAFFNNENVSFTGLSDSNRYIEWFIRGMSSDTTAQNNSFDYWTKYLIGKGSDALSLENFATNWHNTLVTAFPNIAKLREWHEKCYLFPELADGQVDYDKLEMM